MGEGLLITRFLYHTNDTPQSVKLLWTSNQSDAETSTWQHTTLTTDRRPWPRGIRTHNFSRRAATDLRLRPRGHWDRLLTKGCPTIYKTRHFLNNSKSNEDIATKQTHTTDTFLFISHTTNVILFKSRCNIFSGLRIINPLNPELNPICYLLALLGAHHFLHVSRIRVKSLTFRLLMSYTYGAPILDVSRSRTTRHHSR